MKRTHKILVTHILTGLCFLVAGSLLYPHIFGDFVFDSLDTQDTRFEFKADNPLSNGFSRDVTIYTENGITNISFSGKIRVKGTAKITVISNEDDSILYEKMYAETSVQTIQFEVTGLAPYAYYTIKFSSDTASKGQLLLTTNQSLAKHPDTPKRPMRILKHLYMKCFCYINYFDFLSEK